MNDTELVHRIALSKLKGIGPIMARELVAYMGGVDELFTDPIVDRKILSIPNAGPAILSAIKDRSVLETAKRELEFIHKHDVRVMFYLDDAYPRRLKHCVDAPVLLYMQGNGNVNPERVVSIVGTRKATDYGRMVCEELIEGLKDSEVLIVSGLAYGIDICAHRAALRVGLPTIAGVAHGLDRLYPGEHAGTALKMMQNGGLITELSSKSNFHPSNFPSRNRVVAGMSDCTVVIESASKGGSLITADIANSYNRDVLAVPGSIKAKQSQGCNELIKQNKAALISSASDLINFMSWEQQPVKQNPQPSLFVELNTEEESLVSILRETGALTIDELCLRSKMPQSKAAGILLNLEFEGLVRSLPGKVYSLH